MDCYGVLSAILITVSFASLHQVSSGEEAMVELSQEARTEYLVPVVVRVTTETAEVYECVHGGDPENVNYTWYRQDWPSLPDGTKVEGNKLHFTHSTSDLNGLYGCIVINERGTSIAYLYRNVQECFLNWILKRCSWQLVKVIPAENDNVYQCITEPEMENPKYTWRREHQSGLPKGVLHLVQSIGTSERCIPSFNRNRETASMKNVKKYS
ncbi:hypothetical protein KOW79_004831 [Hemibagrus wyckioides]|uniref:Ig-like domain-containing protein n=1 Tax=Hemibagrus wyckioides TaxID=337641 RepID=A0A9D3SNP4_9TELE|nr:hypothetical protein KOW79_004831 [Hemibagrus wyckioides]